MNNHLSESGFGLPQIMILMSIITISTMAAMKVVTVQMVGHKKTQIHTERTEIKRQIILFGNCSATLQQNAITECNTEKFLRLFGQNKLKGAFPLGGKLILNGTFADSGQLAGWMLKSKCTKDAGLEVFAAKLGNSGKGFAKDASGMNLDWEHPNSKIAVVCSSQTIAGLGAAPGAAGDGNNPAVENSLDGIVSSETQTSTSFRSETSMSLSNLLHLELPQKSMRPNSDVELGTFSPSGPLSEINLKIQLFTWVMSERTPFSLDLVVMDESSNTVVLNERFYTGISVNLSYSYGIAQDYFFRTKPGNKYRAYFKVGGQNISANQRMQIRRNSSTVTFKSYGVKKKEDMVASAGTQ